MCVFEFQSSRKKSTLYPSISCSSPESSDISVQLFFHPQEMATKMGQITLVLAHHKISCFNENLLLDS